MSKTILIDAIIREQPRVAITHNAKLINIELDSNKERTKGNIYVGIVTKMQNAFEAAFVDYGDDKHGFLSFKSLSQEHKVKQSDGSEKVNLKVGDRVLVQIEKEKRGGKGAALTSQISLAGSYLVLMPGNPDCHGVSKRVDSSDREVTKSILSQLKVPEDMGLIIRTAGVGQTAEDLEWDLQSLITLHSHISTAAKEHTSPTLIFQESDLIIRSLRDHLKQDVDKIIVNDLETFERAKKHLSINRPEFIEKLSLYDTSKVPLFTHFQIEPEIEKLYCEKIDLPSGGSIVIEQCEAMTAIDVNSGGATQGQDIEETAYRTNLEAVTETANQVRLRNLSGIIDIDFIDMSKSQNRQDIEKAFGQAIKLDRAKIKTDTISSLTGCMRISRQRNGASLSESHQTACPRCDGTGRIRTIPSFSIQIIRKIEETIALEHTDIIMVRVSTDISAYIINELRHHLDRLQKIFKTYIMVIPTEGIQYPKYTMKRMKIPAGGSLPDSFDEKVESSSVENIPEWSTAHKRDIPKVTHDTTRNRAAVKNPGSGILKQLVSWVFSGETSSEKSSDKPARKQSQRNSQRRAPRKNMSRNRPASNSQQQSQRRTRGPRRMRQNYTKDIQTSDGQQPSPSSQHKIADALDD